ncbi:hypothetical protein LMG26788_02156 [Achromobacter pulmonis]|uniref:Uncharacterized protein n=1 Tax=Achromobacter pulmonis TaxID=1389932 RepID=A0A6S7CZ38_9BURK|nr:hypothetical protein LMG26788_02156 [Achromobacter pulmonis]
MHSLYTRPPYVLSEGDRYVSECGLIALPVRDLPGGQREYVLVRPDSPGPGSAKALTRAPNAESQARFFKAATGRTDSPAWRTSSLNDDRRQK